MADVKLKKELGKADVALLVIPDAWYPHTIVDVAKQLASDFNKVCYVSLDKLYDSLTRDLEAGGVDPSKFFFVDCMSKRTLGRVEEAKDCQYISSPYALSELRTVLIENLREKEFDALLFDSLSSLQSYTQTLSAVRFLDALVRVIRDVGTKAFFSILEGDAQSPIARNLGMFVDKTINV